MKSPLQKLKTVGLSMLSGIALVVIVWLLIYGKIKAVDLIRPFLDSVPKDQQGLTKLTESVLSEAVGEIKKGDFKQVVTKGGEIFETSQYAEPAREMRENVKQKIYEVVDSAKQLPVQEINIIKRQVCKEWFEEVATESGRN